MSYGGACRRKANDVAMRLLCAPGTVFGTRGSASDLYAGRELEHMEYYAAASAVDWNVGRLLARLKSLGLEENTLVSFTADHGETFGKRLGSGNKTVSYEESAKVPLLVRWPARLPRGLTYEGGVCTVDLMPTILEAARLPIPARVQGRSRLVEIEKKQTGWKAPVFLQNITQRLVDGRPAIERAVRTKEWKLIIRSHPRNELYNLERRSSRETGSLCGFRLQGPRPGVGSPASRLGPAGGGPSDG